MHSYKLRNGYYHKKMTLTELILCNGKGKYSQKYNLQVLAMKFDLLVV